MPNVNDVTREKWVLGTFPDSKKRNFCHVVAGLHRFMD